jgi:hypothetical protein
MISWHVISSTVPPAVTPSLRAGIAGRYQEKRARMRNPSVKKSKGCSELRRPAMNGYSSRHEAVL